MTRSSELTSDRGAVAVFVALFMVSALILLGFVVDRGRIFVLRSQIQNAADAAALAAAQDLCLDPDPVTTAKTFARANGFDGGPGPTANSTVIVTGPVAVGSINDRNVRLNVQISQPMTMIFGGVTGVPTVQVAAQATVSRKCTNRFQFVTIQSATFNGSNVDLSQSAIWAGNCFWANKQTLGVVAVSTSPDYVGCSNGRASIDNNYPAPNQAAGTTPKYNQDPITAEAAATSAGVDTIKAATEADPTTWSGNCRDATGNTNPWAAWQPILCDGSGPSDILTVPSGAFNKAIIAEASISLPNGETISAPLVFSRTGSITLGGDTNIAPGTILYAPNGNVTVQGAGGQSTSQVNGIVIAQNMTINGGNFDSSGGAVLPGAGPYELIQ